MQVLRHHRAWLGLAAVLAILADAGGLSAQRLVANCTQAPWAAMLQADAWLAHIAAYPCTCAWMALSCWPLDGTRMADAWAPALRRCVRMAVAMVPGCVAAAWTVARWRGPADPAVYAFVMVFVSMSASAWAGASLHRLGSWPAACQREGSPS